MLRYRLYLTLILILWYSVCFGNEKPHVDYEQYMYQKPTFIDCQQLDIDEKAVGGKHTRPTFCFYDVVIGDNKHMIMWHNVHSGETGFGSLNLSSK